jgi:hypothetical protein
MNIEVAIAILLTNAVVAIIIVGWCGRKAKELTDKNNRKK